MFSSGEKREVVLPFSFLGVTEYEYDPNFHHKKDRRL